MDVWRIVQAYEVGLVMNEMASDTDDESYGLPGDIDSDASLHPAAQEISGMPLTSLVPLPRKSLSVNAPHAEKEDSAGGEFGCGHSGISHADSVTSSVNTYDVRASNINLGQQQMSERSMELDQSDRLESSLELDKSDCSTLFLPPDPLNNESSLLSEPSQLAIVEQQTYRRTPAKADSAKASTAFHHRSNLPQTTTASAGDQMCSSGSTKNIPPGR